MTPDAREFLHQTSLRVPTVNRALALYVALLAGFWGGHKFLLGARREGWVYLALALTTAPLWASLADSIDLYRQPAVGQGFCRRRVLKRHPADAWTVEAATWRRLAFSSAWVACLVIGAASGLFGG